MEKAQENERYGRRKAPKELLRYTFPVLTPIRSGCVGLVLLMEKIVDEGRTVEERQRRSTRWKGRKKMNNNVDTQEFSQERVPSSTTKRTAT